MVSLYLPLLTGMYQGSCKQPRGAQAPLQPPYNERNNLSKRYTEDGTEIVWQSTVTWPMVRDLTGADREALVEELDQAVSDICSMYGADEY